MAGMSADHHRRASHLPARQSISPCSSGRNRNGPDQDLALCPQVKADVTTTIKTVDTRQRIES